MMGTDRIENTIRWLFSEQQKQQSPVQDEDMMNPDNETPPDVVDPRQHTLYRFFKTSRSSLPQSPSDAGVWKGHEASFCARNPQHHQPHAADTDSPSQTTDTDMDVDTDMDSGSDESSSGLQGLGWRNRVDVTRWALSNCKRMLGGGLPG